MSAADASTTGPLADASFERDPSDWVILVHGGAGDLAPEVRGFHEEGCRVAAHAGGSILRDGGGALDAVEEAVRVLEDNPRFNAGTGACLNEEGEIELDAAIMEGRDLRAGGVTALPPFAHPISIARAVLEDGWHVLYAGDGGARLAVAKGFSPSPLAAMRTESSIERWNAVRAHGLDSGWAGGTVGAVARDRAGHVAAATSTGGMVNKRVGRVGDAPIIGAGTYADDALGAASTTGHGESFVRTAFAARVVQATAGARLGARLLEKLTQMRARVGGSGGVIVVSPDGRSAWARTTRTMSWALERQLAGAGGHSQEGGT